MKSITEKKTDYDNMTTYSESNLEYISKHKQNYLSSMVNIFTNTCSAGVNEFVLGCELDVSPFQRFKG